MNYLDNIPSIDGKYVLLPESLKRAIVKNDGRPAISQMMTQEWIDDYNTDYEVDISE